MAHELSVDLAKNRFYLKLIGLMDDAEAKQAADEAVEAFRKLKPRFTGITDISEFRPMSQAGVEQVKRCGMEGVKLGMLATCRILGPSGMAKFQFQRASQEAGYLSFVAATREEAERILDDVVAGRTKAS